MAVWTSISYAYKSLLTSAKMTQNQANFLALAEGAASAPRIQTAAIDDNQVTVDKLAHSLDASGIDFTAADSDKLDTYHYSDVIAKQIVYAMIF